MFVHSTPAVSLDAVVVRGKVGAATALFFTRDSRRSNVKSRSVAVVDILVKDMFICF
jgi:hypothetical protein